MEYVNPFVALAVPTNKGLVVHALAGTLPSLPTADDVVSSFADLSPSPLIPASDSPSRTLSSEALLFYGDVSLRGTGDEDVYILVSGIAILSTIDPIGVVGYRMLPEPKGILFGQESWHLRLALLIHATDIGT